MCDSSERRHFYLLIARGSVLAFPPAAARNPAAFPHDQRGKPAGMTRVLVTNDDGVTSPGLRALAEVAAGLGLETTVAAPAWNSSGASASLTGVSEDGRLVCEEQALDGPGGRWAAGVGRVVGVHAAPALIARAGIRGGFGPRPDVVLSGVNDGQNTGHAVLHSGTVGAALTAATHGCRAVAVSLAGGKHLDTAAAVARGVIERALDSPPPLVVNVNVPDVPPEELRGVRRAPLARFGAVQTHVTEPTDGYVEVSFSEVDPQAEPGSDAALLAEGWATVTPLSPVCEAESVDVDPLLPT
jgi:5'-nucleotidase